MFEYISERSSGEWFKYIVCCYCPSGAAAVGLGRVSVTYSYIGVHRSNLKQLSIKWHNVQCSVVNKYWLTPCGAAHNMCWLNPAVLVIRSCQGRSSDSQRVHSGASSPVIFLLQPASSTRRAFQQLPSPTAEYSNCSSSVSQTGNKSSIVCIDQQRHRMPWQCVNIHCRQLPRCWHYSTAGVYFNKYQRQCYVLCGSICAKTFANSCLVTCANYFFRLAWPN
jgi:hypothetical protein